MDQFNLEPGDTNARLRRSLLHQPEKKNRFENKLPIQIF